MLREQILAARERLTRERQTLYRGHAAGTPGVQTCRSMADMLDAIVIELFDHAVAAAVADQNGQDASPGDAGDPDGAAAQLLKNICLVALGGFGRRDVAPFSDIDLMILYRPVAAEQVTLVARRLQRDVCDVGLQLGQSVRTPRQARSLAFSDPEIFTSLVECRFLGGSISLCQSFLRPLARQAQRKAGDLIDEVCAARGRERAQYGDTVHLLEPNLKRSRGSLRDVQLLRWIGFVRYGTPDPHLLQLQGVLSKRDYRQLRDATEWLLRLRNELHFHANRAQDQLNRAEQLRIARLWQYPDEPGLLAVERFMREHFTHTEAVSRIVSRFVEGAQPRRLWQTLWHPLLSHRFEGDFRVGPAEIDVVRRGHAKLEGSLEQILRLADLANLHNKRIAYSTGEVVRRSASQIPDEVSPASAARFRSLLSHPMQLGELLRQLHEWGVLEKLIPAFTHARGLLQFNEYHKYTVDAHCIRAVECATEFRTDDGPLGEAYSRIKHKDILHLALLIHDLGKGFPEDHSERGAVIAAETAYRLMLSPEEADTLKFLVHKHLLMSHLAFRRDTSDERLILQFAIEVGSPRMLRMLYVLTAADLAAVGPGTLNNWKVDVLTEVYGRALLHLAGDGDRSTLAAQTRRAKVLELLKDEPDAEWFAEQVDAWPVVELASRQPEEIAAELRQLAQLEPDDVLLQGRYVPEKGTVECTVATHESVTPGVFHKLTGALTGQGLGILSAQIHTLARGLIVDRFVAVDPDYDEPPPHRLEAIWQAMRDSLKGDKNPSFRDTWSPRRGKRTVELQPLPTRVRIDNTTSDRATIIDIFAVDRRGLLYTIAKTLFDLSLSVSVAKIGTHLDQVVDVFYVTDREGRKIDDSARLDVIRQTLVAAIDLPPQSSASTTTSAKKV